MEILQYEQRYEKKIHQMLLFRFLSSEELADLIKRAEIQQYEEGEYIITQGEVNQSFYAVLEGSVTVSVRKKDNSEAYICTIGEGEVFGEAGMFQKMSRTANVVSLDNSRVLEITRKNMIDFINSYPKAGIKILMVIIYGLLRKLKDANQELAYERLSDLGQSDIDAMVRDFLAPSN